MSYYKSNKQPNARVGNNLGPKVRPRNNYAEGSSCWGPGLQSVGGVGFGALGFRV